MEKAWSMTLMEHNPNRKDILAPTEYTLMVYIPNGNDMVLLKIAFRTGNRHGKG